jgi:glucose-1-phosphate thymidylyltransferase
MTRRAVVLARGLGTRMRAEDPSVSLSPDQRRAADAGLKAMMPINGRPFLDYVLSALADAGIRDVALVVAPRHEAIDRYYFSLPLTRIALTCVVQPDALGTANAVLAAEAWCGGDPFLALNADNLYPAAALETLAALDEPGLPAFDAEDLVRTSNIAADRIRAFAVIDVGPDGYLTGIVEKPAIDLPPTGGLDLPPKGGSYRRSYISMNCWRFDHRIFAACRDVPRSTRGEHELPEAVSLAASRGVRFKAFRAKGPVLDLSRRADMADVARRLAGTTPLP